MKQLITIILLSILASVSFQSTSFAQQTPANTMCNESSGVQWTANTEPDMDHYNVYIANNPDIKNASPPVFAITVPHPAVGVGSVVHTLNASMSEGPKYFSVTAADKAGNESAYSDEIGCMLDYNPNAPTLQFIFTKPVPVP